MPLDELEELEELDAPEELDELEAPDEPEELDEDDEPDELDEEEPDELDEPVPVSPFAASFALFALPESRPKTIPLSSVTPASSSTLWLMTVVVVHAIPRRLTPERDRNNVRFIPT